MGFLERRLRKAALRGAEKVYECRIRFSLDEAAFEEEWPDAGLTHEHREWLEVFAPCEYLIKQVFNLGPHDHGVMLWDPLLFGHELSGEYVDDFEVVTSVARPVDTHFAQLFNRGEGVPFIQTPSEGKRAMHGQLAAVSVILLLDHVRGKSPVQRERLDAALAALRERAQSGDHIPEDPATMTVLPRLVMADLVDRGLIADVYGLRGDENTP